MRLLLQVLAFAATASALPGSKAAFKPAGTPPGNPLNNTIRDANSVPAISDDSVTLLFQNVLNTSASGAHISALLTGPVTLAQTSSVCGAFNESPMPATMVTAHSDDILAQFNYICFKNNLPCPTGVWLDDGVLKINDNATTLSIVGTSEYEGQSLAALCTQSDTSVLSADSDPSASNQVIVSGANGNTFNGFRNKKSFRFLGIPYSNTPGRFEYSSVNSATQIKFDATAYGAECPQTGQAGQAPPNEDCLFLDLFTPFLPASGQTASLRPVMLFIHGGRFLTGDGSHFDGGNLASREDIVTVSINYRLSTYGFMAVSNSTLAGNYGVSDMISALDWVVDNIAHFGGDPTQITIAGQSAGAAAVRILLGSKEAIGKYQRAIVMSNLGGGTDLGEASDIGTSNSEYYTIEESYKHVGEGVLQEAKCSQQSTAAQVACLKSYSGDLSSFSSTSRFPVQDGLYITTPHLEVENKGAVANVPVLMGNLLNDGASFTGYSTSCTTEASCIAQNLNVGLLDAQSIIDSGLFPYHSTGDLHADSFNVSQRVRTSDTFSCIDQDTAYAAVSTGSTGPVYYYQYIRTYGGYAEASSEIDGYGPTSPEYPNGDPKLPYYKLHSGELAFALGNELVFRDEADYWHLQLMTAYWGAFVRTGDPNPDPAWLEARGYTMVSSAIEESSLWKPVAGKTGPIMELDYPAVLQDSFNNILQCDFLKYNLTYYIDI